jgi:hypothetical protein
MRHRPSRRAATLIITGVAIVIIAASAVIAAQSPPAPSSTDKPSAVAGEPVPAIEANLVTRIAVAGDTGTGTASEFATAAQMQRQEGSAPYAALLLLGDLVYEDGDAANIPDRVLVPFAPILDSGAVLLPVLGNHDYGSDEQRQILAALGQTQPWYTAMVGNVRIVVLDSNQVDDGEQQEWLHNTLAEPTPDGIWTVVAMHHPAYSAGSHGSDLAVRNAWGPLFDEFNVPLVLAGHDHDYQRSEPQDGVTYVVSGAGAKTRPTGIADFTAVSTSTLHYLDLLAYQDTLVGRAIDENGTLVDTFAIDR